MKSQLGWGTPAPLPHQRHGGEHGMFGDEEDCILRIERAKRDGVRAVGPVSADSVFPLAKSENSTRFFPCITTRGTSPVKHSILLALFP